MNMSAYQHEIKAIKMINDRSLEIADIHSSINDDLSAIKEQLLQLGMDELTQTSNFIEKKAQHLETMKGGQSLESVDLALIYSKAELLYKGQVSLDTILSDQDWAEVDQKLDQCIQDFNYRYGLDMWDYAISGSCGLFAAMLDVLFIRAPLKPTVKWTQEVDGLFNKAVQKAFNKILPPDLSDALSKSNTIGSADSSVITDLVGSPSKTLNPSNHRLRSLAHDPILGFIFGVFDMLNGTCTVVNNGTITSYPSVKNPINGSVFQLLGRMLGHLLSDVNSPTKNDNRGMGLPAPFMGILRLFEGVPVGDSNFAKQIEWMYVNGYDFRQFVVSSVPMTIMEVMLRAFYVVKQIKIYDSSFGETIIDTMPLKMNPRFRMMLALSYGTSSAVNAGKMYITKNILNANYASWMGLSWNGFHALKWALLDKNLRLWEEIEAKEIEGLNNMLKEIDKIKDRAVHLPV